MAKLRKMLGSMEDPVVTGLMALIETQSKATLARWAEIGRASCRERV